LLGWCYLYGLGVDKKPDESETLYRSAAQKGNAAAQYELGCFLESGKYGIAKNREEANQWFNLAAKNDYPWTRECEQGWLMATFGIFCLYWWFFFLCAVYVVIAFFVPMDRNNTFFILEGIVFAVFPLICWIGGLFGYLRLSRWGTTWMAIASIYWLWWMTLRSDGPPSRDIGSIVLGGMIIVPLALVVCYRNGQRTYWLERKKNDRAVSFWPSLLLASVVFAEFVALYHFVQ
jgi:hypothetical protein